MKMKIKWKESKNKEADCQHFSLFKTYLLFIFYAINLMEKHYGSMNFLSNL